MQTASNGIAPSGVSHLTPQMTVLLRVQVVGIMNHFVSKPLFVMALIMSMVIIDK